MTNTRFGGFGLSNEGWDAYLKCQGTAACRYSIRRDDPILVRIVQEMGARANGRSARLNVVEIPSNVEWVICEYDGNEWVAEKHRMWPADSYAASLIVDPKPYF